MKKLLILAAFSLLALTASAQRGPLPPLTEVSRDTLMLLTTYETADKKIVTEKVLTVEIKMKQTTEYLVHFPVYFPEARVKWREPRKTYEK